MRVGHELLATAAGLASGRCLGAAACAVTRETAGSGPHQLDTGGGGQRLCPGDAPGKKTGPNPTDRAKAGSKHHVLTDANGIPLAALLTAANRHDVTQLLPLVDAIPAVGGKRGAPRRRPDIVQGDRGYDSQPHRHALQARGIRPLLARRHTPHGSGLGTTRWVVERTLAWLHQYRRLRVRDERREDIHDAFLQLACSLICWHHLPQP